MFNNQKSNSMSLWGSLITGGSSLLGSVMDFFGQKDTNAANERNVRATNEMNYKIASEANSEQMRRLIATQDFDREQWSLNNKYNSFGAQMQRARDAGLNPQSVGQNVPSTQVTSQSAPVPVVPQMQAFQEAPNSLHISDVAQRVAERLDKMFEHRQALKQERRDEEKHDLEMLGLTEDFVSKVKSNMNDKTEAERRRAEAEAEDAENAVSRNVQRHNQEMRKTDSDIRAIDKGIEHTEQQIEQESQRMKMEQAAHELQQKMLAQNIKIGKAQESEIYNSIKMANEVNRRANEIHDKDLNSKQLDNDLKQLMNMYQRARVPAKLIAENILEQNELFHEGLKNDSEINMIVERLFGLGFRDIGNALKALVSSMK